MAKQVGEALRIPLLKEILFNNLNEIIITFMSIGGTPKRVLNLYQVNRATIKNYTINTVFKTSPIHLRHKFPYFINSHLSVSMLFNKLSSDISPFLSVCFLIRGWKQEHLSHSPDTLHCLYCQYQVNACDSKPVVSIIRGLG